MRSIKYSLLGRTWRPRILKVGCYGTIVFMHVSSFMVYLLSSIMIIIPLFAHVSTQDARRANTSLKQHRMNSRPCSRAVRRPRSRSIPYHTIPYIPYQNELSYWSIDSSHRFATSALLTHTLARWRNGPPPCCRRTYSKVRDA